MTRITRMGTDLLDSDPCYPCHPWLVFSDSPWQTPDADAAVEVAAARDDAAAIGGERERRHGVGVPLEFVERFAGRHVPQPDDAVLAAGDQLLAVGRHRHRLDLAGVPLEPARLFAGRDVPDTHHVVAGREQVLAVAGEEKLVNRVALRIA